LAIVTRRSPTNATAIALHDADDGVIVEFDLKDAHREAASRNSLPWHGE
jgi:hypothetical protein